MKLPKPRIQALCGVCYGKMTWSHPQCQFECPKCCLKATPNLDGTFKMEFLSPNQTFCYKLPPKTVDKSRYLRRNEEKELVYRTYLTFYYPCALPNSHTSPHYFCAETKYIEEEKHTGSVPIIDEKTQEIVFLPQNEEEYP